MTFRPNLIPGQSRRWLHNRSFQSDGESRPKKPKQPKKKKRLESNALRGAANYSNLKRFPGFLIASTRLLEENYFPRR